MNRPMTKPTAITVTIAVLLAGAIATMTDPAHAADLTEQFTTKLNQGTRSNARDQADRWLQQGRSEAAAGNLSEAILSWRKAQLWYEELKDMDGQAIAFGYLAAAYQELGHTAAQEDALRRQLAVTRDQRNFNGQIVPNNDLGRLLARREMGTPAAGELFMEGMDVASSTRNQAGEVLTARNMSWLANSLDEPEPQTRHLEEHMVPVAQWVANPISLSAKLGDRATTRYTQQRYYMATRFEAPAYRLAQAAGSPEMQYATIANLVANYRRMGRYDLARDWLDERLQLARSLNDPQEELATLTALGDLNLDVQRTALAQRYFEQALVVAEQLDDAQQTGLIRERLAGFEQP